MMLTFRLLKWFLIWVHILSLIITFQRSKTNLLKFQQGNLCNNQTVKVKSKTLKNLQNAGRRKELKSPPWLKKRKGSRKKKKNLFWTAIDKEINKSILLVWLSVNMLIVHWKFKNCSIRFPKMVGFEKM